MWSRKNGGDGFVAAQFLSDMGHHVTVYSLMPKSKYIGDAKTAMQGWQGKIKSWKSFSVPEKENIVVIDAVFGTGLSKPLGASVCKVFGSIAEAKIPVVAVDVPSGVYSDTGQADPHCLKAASTVTFFKKKLAHALMDGLSFCGPVHVYDIGIENNVLHKTGFTAFENSPKLWLESFPKIDAAKHKYKRGHAVMYAGPEMTGAVQMASQACMRIGAGLCSVAGVSGNAVLFKTEAPHILYESMQDVSEFSKHLKDERRNAVLIGAGAGLKDKEGLRRAVLDVLASKKRVVLDADALTCFSGNPDALFAALHENVVLTPHEGEFNALFHSEGARARKTSESKLDGAIDAADKIQGACLVLKGADTVIVQRGERPVINTHASPWLATAGSGDVLAGIITGLLAQGMEAYHAAQAAVWVHGDAALLFGEGLTAPDIVNSIPAVLHKIY